MKRILVFLFLAILGSIFGCLASIFWYSGANTFWQPIDYFPFSVQKVIGMKTFGKEIWVEANENEFYKITYPCSKYQTCWEKEVSIPSDLPSGNYDDNKAGSFIVYKVSTNKCENDAFVHPLFRNIKTCITSMAMAADASWITSLALTDDGKLWIWDKPWESPYTELSSIISFAVLGMIIGSLAGVFLYKKSP